MPRRFPSVITLAVVLALLPACSGGSADAGAAGGGQGSGGATTATTSTAGTVIRAGGDSATFSTPQGPVTVTADSAPGSADVLAQPLQWTGDLVVSRLREGGLPATPAGSVQQPGFGPPGLRVTVSNGAGEVRAFVYGDPGAAGNAARGFDPARVGEGSRTASLVVDNNLAAIVLTADPALRERVRVALLARKGEGR